MFNVYSHLVFQTEKIFTRSLGDRGRVSPDVGFTLPELPSLSRVCPSSGGVWLRSSNFTTSLA